MNRAKCAQSMGSQNASVGSLEYCIEHSSLIERLPLKMNRAKCAEAMGLKMHRRGAFHQHRQIKGVQVLVPKTTISLNAW